MSFDPDRLDARDPALIGALLPAIRNFNRHYVRLQVSGLEHVPCGAALLVGNHNGGIAGPDLLCTLGTLWERLGTERSLYGLTHDFVMRQCWAVGAFLQRLGALRASPSNAVRALAADALVLVYPGGDLDAYRAFRDRNRVILGQRLGFVRVAQATGVPIVPIVAQGAHRSAYIFHEGRTLARCMSLSRWGRLSRFPFALALPWGLAPGPWIPYLPLPFTIRLRVLPPVIARPDDDPAAVQEHVRDRMQAALNELTS